MINKGDIIHVIWGDKTATIFKIEDISITTYEAIILRWDKPIFSYYKPGYKSAWDRKIIEHRFTRKLNTLLDKLLYV